MFNRDLSRQIDSLIVQLEGRPHWLRAALLRFRLRRAWRRAPAFYRGAGR